MSNNYDYQVGDVVDDLICIGKVPPIYPKRAKLLMKCKKCGRTKEMLPNTLHRHSGTTHKACGNGIKTTDPDFYRKWQSMRSRTNNPNYEHYADYGGRGISSEKFRYFIDFYDAMYKSYLKACSKYGKENVSLERKDPNKNYTKSNCCWIHIKEQPCNTRITVRFEITFPDGTKKKYKNISKFCKKYDLNRSCIKDLINGRLKSYKGYRKDE